MTRRALPSPAAGDDVKAPCCTTVKTLATTLALRRGAPLRLEDQTRRTSRPLRRPTVAGSLDADEDDAVHFASAEICRLRVMPRAARACDAINADGAGALAGDDT